VRCSLLDKAFTILCSLLDKAFTYRLHKKYYYEKTAQLYEKAGQIRRWGDTPECLSYKSEKAWYEKATGKRNREFLPSRGLD
jgi:hypothetical protein